MPAKQAKTVFVIPWPSNKTISSLTLFFRFACAHKTEVHLGKMLGHGQFGEVLELARLDLQSYGNSNSSTQNLAGALGVLTAVVTAAAPTRKKQRRGDPNNNKNIISSGHETEDSDDSSCSLAEGLDLDNKEFEPAAVEVDEVVTRSPWEATIYNQKSLISNDEAEKCELVLLQQRQRRAMYMATHLTRNYGVARYAVKRLRRIPKNEVDDDDCTTVQKQHDADAMVDLVCEALFLQNLRSHSNIIKLRATVGVPGTPSFMLVLDRLQCNLHGRMREWQIQDRKFRGNKVMKWFLLMRCGRHSRIHKQQKLYAERLLAAFDIARALRHLHKHSILYRDIKVRGFLSIILHECLSLDSHIPIFLQQFNSQKMWASMQEEIWCYLILAWRRN